MKPDEVGGLTRGDIFGPVSPRLQKKTIGSMGLVYLPTLMVDFYGKLVGKRTMLYMDPMGKDIDQVRLHSVD